MSIWDDTTWGAKKRVVDFGVKDSKGREVGAIAYVSRREQGDGYRWEVQSARDGVKFGALPQVYVAASETGAMESAMAKIEEARKRVTKDAAKTGGVYLTAGERKALKQRAR